MTESFLNNRIVLHPGDCLAVLPTLTENSIDSVVCDPPYHLTSIVKRFGAENAAPAKSNGATGVYGRASAGFMGKVWDGGDVAFRVETWREVLRVMKPGAYILAFSSTRTFGRMQVAIEDAGFITHPFIAWIFGSGFPKSTRVNACALTGPIAGVDMEGFRYGGQALKPAIEPIYMGQKPFSEDTGTANVLKWGTGALNVDGCRVAASADDTEARASRNGSTSRGQVAVNCYGTFNGDGSRTTIQQGRWPANVIHDGSDEVVGMFPQSTSGGGDKHGRQPSSFCASMDWESLKGTSAGGDSGSAARFFYSAKADSDDRLGSKHPTVKKLDLIQYLCRLVTPPGGTVLDCFAGTGTTGEAAFREGFKAILIEREAEYCEDIRRRMALVLAGPDERSRESIKARNKDKPVDHGPLFAPEYDAESDIRNSVTLGLQTVKERMASGGPAWPREDDTVA